MSRSLKEPDGVSALLSQLLTALGVEEDVANHLLSVPQQPRVAVALLLLDNVGSTSSDRTSMIRASHAGPRADWEWLLRTEVLAAYLRIPGRHVRAVITQDCLDGRPFDFTGSWRETTSQRTQRQHIATYALLEQAGFHPPVRGGVALSQIRSRLIPLGLNDNKRVRSDLAACHGLLVRGDGARSRVEPDGDAFDDACRAFLTDLRQI
jgi:hypothetical protein